MLKRFVFEFPDPESFWDRIHDRLHTVVERYIYQSRENSKFTLIVNAIPRDKPDEIDEKSIDPPIEYVSTQKQKELLEKGQNEPTLKYAWDELNRKKLKSSTADEGAVLWKWVIEKSLSYDKIYNNANISDNTLEAYFDESEKELNDAQKFEKPILSHYFNIKAENGKKSDRFLPIPLIQFGEIDGFVYLVYQDEDHPLFNDDNIKDLINGFSIEYEGVMLAWDLVQDRLDRTFAFRDVILNRVCADNNEEYFSEKNRSPIFNELGFPKYYRDHRSYFKSRFEQHDQMLYELYRQMIKHGSTTILLDSFAHNISAHALTTLTWIFKKRAKLKLKEQQLKLIETAIKREADPALRHRYQLLEDEQIDTYADLIRYGGSLTTEIFPFLKFLQEKGGFWSGLTRDINAGGQVNSLFSILWFDFVANALYLGTIAESEQIRRLNIDITFHSLRKNILEQKEFENQYDGTETFRFCTIDLGQEVKHHYQPKDENNKNSEEGLYVFAQDGKSKIWYEELRGLEQMSRFVELGEKFMDLRKKLLEVKVFFPGSVVGKHAFFTLIENELRNIKHYFGDIMSKDGTRKKEMTLNISIQPASLGNNDSIEAYRIGLWLGLASPLSNLERADGNPHLVQRRFDMLWEDIIDEKTRQPRLGGNSQDKVCAAMLFNSSFSSVQWGSLRTLVLKPSHGMKQQRDEIFYPWITPAVCYTDTKTEFQVLAQAAVFKLSREEKEAQFIMLRPYYQVQREEFDEKIKTSYAAYEKKYMSSKNEGKGYLKKYFLVWRGDTIRLDQDDAELEMDNLGRFRFVLARKENKNLWQKARENGVIRIIENIPIEINNDTNDRDTLIAAYQEWLKLWISEDKLAFTFIDTVAGDRGTMYFDKSSVNCLTFYTDLPFPNNDDNYCLSKEPTSEELEMLNDIVIEKELERKLNCAHNVEGLPQDLILYRRHGVINQHFVPQEERTAQRLMINKITSDKIIDLFETLATRVCLFDNRLYNRVNTRRLDFYKNKLKLYFGTEDIPQTESTIEYKQSWGSDLTIEQLTSCNFLVIHLSFIDRIIHDKYASDIDYEEGNIGLFIEKEIEPYVRHVTQPGLRDNFILILTTGRGRQNWKVFLEDSKYKDRYHKYKRSIIFRPIESLISVIEDSMMLKDDFDLKYRLIRVLFGS